MLEIGGMIAIEALIGICSVTSLAGIGTEEINCQSCLYFINLVSIDPNLVEGLCPNNK
jgi:hypothetical protein